MICKTKQEERIAIRLQNSIIRDMERIINGLKKQEVKLLKEFRSKKMTTMDGLYNKLSNTGENVSG